MRYIVASPLETVCGAQALAGDALRVKEKLTRLRETLGIIGKQSVVRSIGAPFALVKRDAQGSHPLRELRRVLWVRLQ